MEKDATYHESAIRYNDELAQFADQLADTLEHTEVKRWCRSVAKQHKFHLGKHERALKRLNEKEELEMNEQTPAATEPDEGIVVQTYDGQTLDDFEEATDAIVDGAMEKAVESEPMAAAPIDAGSPNPEQAAEPVDAGVGVETHEQQFARAQAEAEAANAKREVTNG